MYLLKYWAIQFFSYNFDELEKQAAKNNKKNSANLIAKIIKKIRRNIEKFKVLLD